MTAVSVPFALLALLLTVGGGLVLYALVRSEHDRRSVTDRETAERLARRDDPDAEGDSDGDDVRGNHWD